VIGLIVKKR